jgi:hypothetical protein
LLLSTSIMDTGIMKKGPEVIYSAQPASCSPQRFAIMVR